VAAAIEVFVYPGAWPARLGWAATFLALLAFRGGRISLDRVLRIP